MNARWFVIRRKRSWAAVTALLSLSAVEAQTISPPPGQLPGCLLVANNRRWGAIATLASTAQEVTHPVVAVAPTGDAVAAWVGLDKPGVRSVYVSRYKGPFLLMPGSWGPVQNVGPAGATNRRVRVAMDNKGNALIVWEGDAVGGQVLRGSYYEATANLPTRVDIPGTADRREHLAIALRGGRGAAVWVDVRTGGYYPTLSNSVFLVSSRTWTKPTSISATTGYAFQSPSIAIDDTERMVAVWEQSVFGSNGFGQSIYGARHYPVSGWTAAEEVSVRDGANPRAMRPSLHLNGNGRGAVGYVHWADSPRPMAPVVGYTVRLNRIDLALPSLRSLTTPRINDLASNNPLVEIRAASDSDGDAMTVFTQTDTGSPSVKARSLTRFDMASPNPSADAYLLESRTGDAQSLWFGMDRLANGVAGWIQSDGQAPSVYVHHTRVDPNCPPSPNAVLLENSSETVFASDGAMSSSGNAAAVWTTGTGAVARSVYVRNYQ